MSDLNMLSFVVIIMILLFQLQTFFGSPERKMDKTLIKRPTPAYIPRNPTPFDLSGRPKINVLLCMAS